MTTTSIPPRRRIVSFSREELDRRFGRSLTAVLNSGEICKRDRFATPSVLTDAECVDSIVASDVSISASSQPLAI